jgi:hypothetical protein
MGEDLAVQNEWREKFCYSFEEKVVLGNCGTIRIGSQKYLRGARNNEDRIY